jgi:hypothetical protein
MREKHPKFRSMNFLYCSCAGCPELVEHPAILLLRFLVSSYENAWHNSFRARLDHHGWSIKFYKCIWDFGVQHFLARVTDSLEWVESFAAPNELVFGFACLPQGQKDCDRMNWCASFWFFIPKSRRSLLLILRRWLRSLKRFYDLNVFDWCFTRSLWMQLGSSR